MNPAIRRNRPCHAQRRNHENASRTVAVCGGSNEWCDTQAHHGHPRQQQSSATDRDMPHLRQIDDEECERQAIAECIDECCQEYPPHWSVSEAEDVHHT